MTVRLVRLAPVASVEPGPRAGSGQRSSAGIDDWERAAAAALATSEITVVRTTREDLDRLLAEVDDAGPPLVVCTGVAGLNALVERLVRRERAATLPLGWVPDPDRSSRALAVALGLPVRAAPAALLARDGVPRALRLVRDDHGGVLLSRGRLGPAAGRRLGAQTYHDDQRIADGPIRGLTVRPDHAADCAVTATVRAGWGRGRTSTGRSVQTACDEAVVTVDGARRERSVTRWTWYADPRQHWLLRR